MLSIHIFKNKRALIKAIPNKVYIWVFLIFLKDRVKFETEELLGTGILAMAVTFGISWLILNYKGIKND